MTRRKSVIFGILMLFKIFFQWICHSVAMGTFCQTYRWLNLQFRFLEAQALNWLFPTIWIYGSCCHVYTYVHMYVCMDIYAFRSSYFPARVARLLFIFIAFHLISLPAKKSSRDTFFIYMYVCSWWIINLIGFLAAASSYLLSSWRDVCKWSTKSIKDCQPPIILISPA